MTHSLLLLLPLLLAAAPTTQWTTSPTTGSTTFHAFPHAPYPHPSRDHGHTYKAETFPKDPHYADPTVAIVIPPHYRPTDTVDYVVHFHGWSADVARALPKYRLAEQLAESNVNAILLLPQGPKNAKDSGGGKLELDPGAFKRLLEEVTTYLHDQGKIHTTKIGRVALSAHSGGYKVTARVLHHGGLSDQITDVILLDASYGNPDDFTSFAQSHPAARILSFHTQHLDDENQTFATLLTKTNVPHRTLPESDLTSAALSAPGVTFIPTKLPHNDVPIKSNYFCLALTSSSLATAAPTTSPGTHPPRTK